MDTVAISSNGTGFTTCSYSLTALPVVSYMKLQGFASDGVSWDDIEPAAISIGADGLASVNQKPVLYTGTFTLKANSNSRNVLDMLVDVATPVHGKPATSYEIVLTEKNSLTGFTYVYTGGLITSASGGNSANMEDGQADKTYKVTFTSRTAMPM